jgi:nicotinamide-nucleotide amidase
MPSPKLQILLTGNELMTGDIVDSNSAMMAQVFKEIGLNVSRKVTLADDLPLLVNEIKNIAHNSDILIINGGLGPTVDDLTAQALALAIESSLEQNHIALSHVTDWCKKRAITLNAANTKQAILPVDCQIIANKTGSAVGFSIRYMGCDIYCTPGVPSELKIMLSEQIIPIIRENLPNNIISNVVRIQVFGIGESSLQTLIDERLPSWPVELELGFRAGDPLLEVKLTANSSRGVKLRSVWQDKLVKVLGDHFIAEIQGKALTLAEHLMENLKQKNISLTTAESCTGGLIASKLTAVAGASAIFSAGFVTYSNLMKHKILGVPNKTLQQHGAVSEAVVIAMAKGALLKSNANLAIAVSGIAGPKGGSAQKPTGTVWFAWGDIKNIKTQCLLLPYDRVKFQHYVAAIGLDLLRRYQQNLSSTPNYIIERGHNIE